MTGSRGLLHPDRRAERGPGRPRPHHRRGGELRRRLARWAGWPTGSGPKRCWAVSAAGAGEPVHALAVHRQLRRYVAMAVMMEVVGSLGGAGARRLHDRRAATGEERVRSRAYMCSALNVGFTLGALLGGIALAFDSNTVLHGLPWFTTDRPSWVNALAILRLPNASHDERDAGAAEGQGSPARAPLRNPGWMTSTFFDRRARDQPGPAQHRHPAVAGAGDRRPARAAGLAVRHQHRHVHPPPMAAARGVEDVARCAARDPDLGRLLRAAPASSCSYTHDTVGWVTIALVWLGHVTVTGAELFQSAATGGSTPSCRTRAAGGEYQGAAELERHPRAGSGRPRSTPSWR